MDDYFDDFDGIDWEDWMIIGPLSEDIANEKRAIDRAYRDTLGDDYMDPMVDMEDESDIDIDPEIGSR